MVHHFLSLDPDEDPNTYSKKPKEAFLAAVDEYNQFGYSQFGARFRIDLQSAVQLYGFKVT